jgi:hypothetical protein
MSRRGNLLAMVLSGADLCLAGLAVAAPAGSESLQIIEQPPGLDLSTTPVQVDSVRLRIGLGHIQLSGVIYPTESLSGKPVELVFLGQGLLYVDPPDEIEQGQLELFTGSRALAERFTRAVLVIALDEAVSQLVQRPPVADDDLDLATAALLLEEWRASPERKLLDVEARILRDTIGDPLGHGYFCGYFEGTELGKLLYVVDPLVDEQVSLGQFVQLELSEREQRRVRKLLDRGRKQGKLIGTELSDLGRWDTWVSASLGDSEGKPAPGTPGFEALHYEIDVSLADRTLDLEATAVLTLEARVAGLQAVTIDMDANLRPERVTDATGSLLPFLRTRGELTVVLPGPVAAGEQLKIAVEYSGKPIEKVASKTFFLRGAVGWHPHAGLIDRATYDVTFHWPRKLDLVASGTPVDGGEEPDGRQWQRRRLDRRSLGFSFEIGSFELVRRQVGHVQVTVAIDRLGRRAERGLAEVVLATACGALSYFEEIFGPYPLDWLTLVSSPRPLSHGYLGYVTLNTANLYDWEEVGLALGIEDRRTLIAHEIAHQWWGNLVGWQSYRDQWISEAMATYSALLYARNRLGTNQAEEAVLSGPTTGWKTALEATVANGRPIESLGPVVLGLRLSSSLSKDAYEAIVYKKGAVVLDMLSRYFHDQVFNEILRNIVRVASDRTVSTEAFIAMIERLGGTDLSWFSRRYIYGTGLPEIYYDYQLEQEEEGTWTISGEARQQSPYLYRYTIRATSRGSFDVRRTAVSLMDVEESVLVVPFRIGLKAEPEPVPGAPSSQPEGQARFLMITGRTLIKGARSPIRITIEQQPEVFWLDPRSEVFGQFYCESRWPRRITYYQALDLMAAGETEAAEATLRQALDAEVLSMPDHWLPQAIDIDREALDIDARIHLALARLYLDQNSLDQAEAQLDAADDLVSVTQRYHEQSLKDLLCLQARLDLARGRADDAYRNLRRKLLGHHALSSAEGFALLAIAAYATGHRQELQLALERARAGGFDVADLASVL